MLALVTFLLFMGVWLGLGFIGSIAYPLYLAVWQIDEVNWYDVLKELPFNVWYGPLTFTLFLI